MKFTYRPEIDGLRAISVCAVILYHAKYYFSQPFFEGGFIGVDIFFVISGYLITSIILKELVTSGSFSFKHFYERRIRRILPPLLFVILAAFPFAWMYLLPSSFIDFSKSILYSLGFSSNFYFHYSGQQYGAQSGLLNSFLHTWSLSVEEQFYILFPVLLLITFKYFREYLIYILSISFVISLGFSNWTSENYPSASFYFLQTRMWEFLAGSILAYFEIKGYRRKNKILNFIMPIIGVFLIIYTIVFFKLYFPHPSLYTLPAIIGACLIIWFSDSNGIVTRILSTKLFVGIGLISYSLYLWHYPIFALAREINFFVGISNKLIVGSIIIVLSIFSYYFIEQPARNKSNKFKFIFLIIISNYLVIFSLLFFVMNNKYLVFDKKFFEYNELENTRDYWENCVINKLPNINDYCKIGNYNNKVFLIGDSHLIPSINNLGKKLNKKNYELINLIQTGKIYRRKLKEDKRVDFLKDIKNSIFIFGGYYQRESENELKSIFNFYKEDFEIFLKNNNKIIFLTPIPVVKLSSKDIISVIRGKKIEVSAKKTQIIEKNKFATNFINKFKEIIIINLNEIFCDEFKCYAITPKQVILKSDEDHPSIKGAEMINDLIMKEIEKIEFKSK